MGIDCEFRASSVSDVDAVLALPGVYQIYRPKGDPRERRCSSDPERERCLVPQPVEDLSPRRRSRVPRGSDDAISSADRWVITTLLKFVGHGDWTGYPPDGRERIVAALMRSLRPLCADLEYGGDNGVPFYPVTDEMIAEIEGAARAEE